MAIPNNYYFPYFPSPPPAAKPPSHPTPLPPAAKPPRHSTPPPPAAKPPRHSTPPPPPRAAKPPSHSTTPPPPHQPFRPPPPHVHPPPALPPHHGPPPPPHQPFRPPPPHVHPPPALPPHHGPPPPPLPPSPSPNNHPTVIVIVVISFGSVFFLAFLAVALCCFIKKRKKKSTIQETKIIHFDEHRKIKEAIVEGPHGPQTVVLSIEDDVHIDEEIRKNEKSDKRWPCKSSNVQEETDVIHVAEHEKVKEDIVEGPHGSKTVVLTIEDDIHVDEEIRKNERFGKDGHHHHLVHKAGQ